MKYIYLVPSVFFCLLVTSCKIDTPTPKKEPSLKEKESQQVKASIDSLLEDSGNEKVMKSTSNLDENLDFVYVDFDAQRVLNRFNLGELNENRSLKLLLSSQLSDGYMLKKDILETGDGTFDIYKLTAEDLDLAYFYFESDVITTIEIVARNGVPDDMIGPGKTFGDLRETYENPIAYGSEIEGRVFVHENSKYGSVGFRMDAGWGIYEPIDLEDETEILYVQF